MPMDAYRVGDNFVAHFDLPGVDPGSIDLQVEGTTLTVTAERSVPQLENAEWAIAERPYGSYTRQLVLGRSLDTDRLEDRKSTRLNSSHANISYAVFCLKKKKNH